jgi:hypothetical protein
MKENTDLHSYDEIYDIDIEQGLKRAENKSPAK